MQKIAPSKVASVVWETLLRPLKIEPRSLSSLQPHPRNSRIHTNQQIRRLMRSIEEFGFVSPILIDAEGRIIAGTGRVEAAKRLGMESVPAISLEGMTEAQLRAYAIADNRLAELAGLDRNLLALELEYIHELEIDFDLTITGYDTPEIDGLIEGLHFPGEDPAEDEVPPLDLTAPAVSALGDLFRLGRHFLLCGDATQASSFQTLMGDKRAQMVFVDPPYNVRIDGFVGGTGRIRHPEFCMASGEMEEEEFITFLRSFFTLLVAFSEDGSLHFACMDWRHLYELLTAAREIYREMKNLIVWRKSNAGMGTFYRSQHELICVFKHGSAPHINNFELGQHGRYRSNVWDYPGLNAFGADRLKELQSHPTPKPLALVSDAILDCSKRGGIVLDCFGGSGTTLLAAEKTGRRAFLMEIDPRYIDCTIRRWEEFAESEAVHLETGLTFSQLRKEREDAR